MKTEWPRASGALNDSARPRRVGERQRVTLNAGVSCRTTYLSA